MIRVFFVQRYETRSEIKKFKLKLIYIVQKKSVFSVGDFLFFVLERLGVRFEIIRFCSLFCPPLLLHIHTQNGKIYFSFNFGLVRTQHTYTTHTHSFYYIYIHIYIHLYNLFGWKKNVCFFCSSFCVLAPPQLLLCNACNVSQ